MTSKPALKLPPLKRLLAYRHEELIARFMKEFGFDKKFSEQVFRDVLRYLWVAVWGDLQKKPVPNVMFSALMDEMWHTFLLFTEDYQAFCKRYFGGFLHHHPALTLRARHSVDVRSKRNREAVEATWKQLGPAAARRFYSDYQEQFPNHVLRARQAQQAMQRHEASKA